MSPTPEILPSAQECKRNAVQLLKQAILPNTSDARTRNLGSLAHVWATLATVPEPLTAENSVELVSTPEVCRYQTRERL